MDELLKSIKWILIAIFAVQLGLVAYVFWTSYEGRKDLVAAQKADCERGKLDRIDNAAFQRAHSQYIFSVTEAASVKEDVKRAARKARRTFKRTSGSLTKRSKINCSVAFPKARLVP